jgi:hypothetical protein
MEQDEQMTEEQTFVRWTKSRPGTVDVEVADGSVARLPVDRRSPIRHDELVVESERVLSSDAPEDEAKVIRREQARR